MKMFWELLQESVIVQASVTLIVTLVVGTMMVVPMVVNINRPSDNQMEMGAPAELWALVGLVYGFYFGTKKDIAHRKELESLLERLDRREEQLLALIDRSTVLSSA
jgi:hypothetical protein